MGRQPWVVHPNPTGVDMIRLTVDQGVSDHASATVWASLITFTLLYGALGVVWFKLIVRYAKEGPLEHDMHPPGDTDHDEPEDPDKPKQLSFAY